MKTTISKKIYSFILVLTSMFSFNTHAQVTDATFDPTWAAQFQAAIDDGIATGLLQGASVAVYVPGQGTFIGTGGESHSGLPITADMQFCIGNNTNLFTAVILLKLQELGLVSLDDPISSWLPSFQNIDGSATIRQLLKHETGYADFWNEITQEQRDAIVLGSSTQYSPEDVLTTVGPPHFAPGEAWKTSNTNFILAGLVIEAVTGSSYTANLHQYILDPLNMTHTFLAAEEVPNGNVADGWYFGTNLGNVPLTAPMSMHWSTGAIYSTAKEMSTWCKNLYSGNIISQQSLDQLTDVDAATWFGLGMNYTYFPPLPNGSPTYAHSGQLSGYFSVMGYDYRMGTVIVELTNQDDYTNAYFNVLFPLLSTLYFNRPLQANDAGIESVSNPYSNGCNQSITPRVVLKNFGSADLTSVTINYQVDGGTIHTYNWSGNLATDLTANISLPAITVATGSHRFDCYTSNPNGNAEGNTFNDNSQTSFSVNGSNGLSSLNEGFEGTLFPPAGWMNGQNTIFDWGKSKLSLLNGNGCMVKNNYDDPTYGTYDMELPAVNISSMSHPVMSYNYAYGYFPGAYDSLMVQISTDCGASYQNLYYKGGDDLMTAPPTFDPYYPKDNEWKQINLDLSSYSGNVLLRFRDICQFSNQLFIDDVKVTEGCSTPSNLATINVGSTSAKIRWQYPGNANGFDIYYKAGGSGPWQHKSVPGNVRLTTLTGLIPSTNYTWYVTGACNFGLSPESVTSVFTTNSSLRLGEEIISTVGLDVSPNPVFIGQSGTTTISFSVEQSGNVSLKIYDVHGRLVTTLAEKIFESGENKIIWNIGDLNEGIYILRMEADDFSETQKISVVR